MKLFQRIVAGWRSHTDVDIHFHLESETLDTGEKVHFGLWKVVLMILSNGVLWTYWITICIPKAILLGQPGTSGGISVYGLGSAGMVDLHPVGSLFVFKLPKDSFQAKGHPRSV